jgi:hypothetical protein
MVDITYYLKQKEVRRRQKELSTSTLNVGQALKLLKKFETFYHLTCKILIKNQTFFNNDRNFSIS